MKIIDSAVRLASTANGEDLATLLALMDRHDIAHAVVAPADAAVAVANEAGNAQMADLMARYPDRFSGLAVVNPWHGLKLHPWLQAFSLSHPAVVPLVRRAGELGLPVVFHDGTPPYSSPLQIAAVAEQAPQTTVILGHAGLDDLYGDAILACQRQPNVCLCFCGPSCGPVAEMIRRCPVDRLLFGSDGGFAPKLAEIAVGKLLEAGASEQVLRAIFFDNPRRLIGDAPAPTRIPA